MFILRFVAKQRFSLTALDWDVALEWQPGRFIPIKKPCLIHIENVAQLVAVLLNQGLDPFLLMLHCLCFCWGCLSMTLHPLQAISGLKASQPALAQFKLVVFRNSNQISKHIPFWRRTLPVTKIPSPITFETQRCIILSILGCSVCRAHLVDQSPWQLVSDGNDESGFTWAWHVNRSHDLTQWANQNAWFHSYLYKCICISNHIK